MANYGAIKRRMFQREFEGSGVSMVDLDDPFGQALLSNIRASGGRCISYGFDARADAQVLSVEWEISVARLALKWREHIYEFATRMPGRHNALNATAAFSFGMAVGIDWTAIKTDIEETEAPPGRWRPVSEGKPFNVIVDYAHTHGLTQVLSAAKAIVQQRDSRLLTIFGPVGLPDPAKAIGCATAIAAFSDHIVLTTGSAPRSGRILRIKELLDVIRGQTPVEIVLSRSATIERGILAAQPGDIVAILGIGALRRLIIDAQGTAEPADDLACALSISKRCDSAFCNCDASAKCTRRLETFVLTLAEALAQLGHDVVLFALEHGLVADEAVHRALTVLSPLDRLPHAIDVTIALDRALAIDMAIRYPHATRLYAMHNALEEWLPPPEPGIVAGTLAPNTRFETLARGLWAPERLYVYGSPSILFATARAASRSRCR